MFDLDSSLVRTVTKGDSVIETVDKATLASNDIFWTTTVKTTGSVGLTSGIVNLTGETLKGGVIQVYNNTIAGLNIAACTSTLT